MNKRANFALRASLVIVLIACNENKVKNDELQLFTEYYNAVKQGSDEKWNFTADTVKLWYDEKKGEPILQIKGKPSTGKWKEWDEVMNSSSNYDSLWFDQEEKSIKGYFYENNDFYQLIGKSPTKTQRTFWLNENKRINEILIYWIPEVNTTTSEHLKPIVDWALENDSAEISELYSNGRIVPSKENALRWKKLLNKYNTN